MTIGVVHSCFDLLHAGHILFLKRAKSQCDKLVAFLQTEARPGKDPCVETLFERYTRLAACKYVDEIIPYKTEKELADYLLTTAFDFRFIGEDWLDKIDTLTGIEFTRDKIVFIPREHHMSSSELRERLRKQN